MTKMIEKGDSMMKRNDILGLNVNVIYYREFKRQINEYLSNDFLNRITFVSKDMLAMAKEDEFYKEKLENNDLLLWANREMIANQPDAARIYQNGITHYNKLMEALSSVRESKTMLLLYEQEADADILISYVKRKIPKVRIIEQLCLDVEHSMESVINSINAAAPDIILSTIKPPEQEDWIENECNKLNAKLYLGFGGIADDIKKSMKEDIFIVRIIKKVLRYIKNIF